MRVLAGFVALAALSACGGGQPPAAPPPPEVMVATPLQREVTDWDDYTGRFVAPEDVELRARVNGVITAVHFRDDPELGQDADGNGVPTVGDPPLADHWVVGLGVKNF